MWDEIVEALWDVIVVHDEEYDWTVGPAGRQRLQALIGGEIAAGIFALPTHLETNQALRAKLGNLLRDDEHAVQAGRWIVSEWGGIRRGLDAVQGWIGELAGFDDAAIAIFVEQHPRHRISS